MCSITLWEKSGAGKRSKGLTSYFFSFFACPSIEICNCACLARALTRRLFEKPPSTPPIWLDEVCKQTVLSIFIAAEAPETQEEEGGAAENRKDMSSQATL